MGKNKSTRLNSVSEFNWLIAHVSETLKVSETLIFKYRKLFFYINKFKKIKQL